MPYLEPTQDAGRALFMRGLQGPVVMLNLLRFREQAAYRATPDLAPASPISGAEAYDLYVAHSLPLLRKSGGEFLIGPQDEHWDRVMLVRQASLAAFMAFATDPEAMAGLGHRTAALADSRLLPMVEQQLPV